MAKIPRNKGNFVSQASLETPENEKGDTRCEHPIASPVDKYLPNTAAAKITPPAAAFSGSKVAT